MPPPVGFDFETAKEILRLVKKNKNGSLNRPIDSETPIVQNPAMVWAYATEAGLASFDDTLNAWKLAGDNKYYPFNISRSSEEDGIVFGFTNDDGTVSAVGKDADIYVSKFGGEPYLRGQYGFHIGFIFGYNDEDEPQILIGRPPEFTAGASIEVVTDVLITPNGLEISKANFEAHDYDYALFTKFLSLVDVDPVTYAANQGRVVKVNDAATGLEFGPIVDAEYTTFIALSDTPASYGGSKADAYKTCIVGSNGISIVFSAANVITEGFSIKGGGNPNFNFTTISLDGDIENPDNHTYYGTNNKGARGFYQISLSHLYNGDVISDLINQLNTDVTQLLTDVATLQADYATLESRVTALENP
jgi:hypothetical protein